MRAFLLAATLSLSALDASAQCGLTSFVEFTGLSGAPGCSAYAEYTSAQIGPSSVTVTKPTDKISSALMLACATSQTLKSAWIKPSSDIGIQFDNAVITSFSQNINGNDATDTVTFKYTKAHAANASSSGYDNGSTPGHGTGFDNQGGTGTTFDNAPVRRYVGTARPVRASVVYVDANGNEHAASSFQTNMVSTSVRFGSNPPPRGEAGFIEVRVAGRPLARYQFNGGTLQNGELRIPKLNLTAIVSGFPR